MRNWETFFDTLFPWLEKIDFQQGVDFCKIVLNYTINALEVEDGRIFVEKAQQHLLGKLRGEAMTLAQLFEQKGEKRGEKRAEKRAEKNVAANLLAKGFDIKLIAEVTNLSLDEINKLQAELMY